MLRPADEQVVVLMGAASDTVEGAIGDHALSRSLYTRLKLDAPLRRAASIARSAVAGAAATARLRG